MQKPNGDKKEVLDFGFVRLVEYMGSDLSIVRNARVSYDAEWRTGDDKGKDEKLLRYMLKNKHTSPFESLAMTFEVKLPIFVARQWMRHRTFSFNEVSARYAELPEEMYTPDPVLVGTQSKDNKQMRVMTSSEDLNMNKKLVSLLEEQNKSSYKTYQILLTNGMPRELARSVLPLGIYTHFFCTVDLHNLFHFLKLRLHEHSQYEIRVYAEEILEIVKQIAPVSAQAFEDFVLEK